MGRNKKTEEEKCIVYSISVLPSHVLFLNNNPKFKLSNFVQLHLQHHIDEFEEFRQLERRIEE